jgi:hypothetical protein
MTVGLRLKFEGATQEQQSFPNPLAIKEFPVHRFTKP